MRRALVLVALAGCLRDTEFHCTTNTQCGTDGRCEANGYCSVPDRNCASGFEYAAFSGGLTNHCVTPRDAGIDAPGCAPGFLALPGVFGHLYYVITASADYGTQRMTCASHGGTTYLAIPDDINELQALVTAVNQPAMWVGIDDLIVQGNWTTVRGAQATYLPWDTGQPDNQPPGEQCVAALANDSYDDQQCSTTLPAACECEP